MKLGQVYLPSQHGSTIDVWGYKVRNKKGFVHNRCEVDMVQTDTTYNVFGVANIYGDGSTSWNDLGITDWDAHVNGTDNVWVQWEKINGVCHVKQVIAYSTTQTFTEPQYKQLLKWCGDPTCGNGVIPFS